MNKNGKVSKILSIGLIVFLLMGYGLRIMLKAPIFAIDHLYIATGALSVWLFMLSFSEVQNYDRRGHAQKISSWEAVVSCIGILGTMVLFTAGIVLLAVPVNIEGLPAEASNHIQSSMFYLFALDAAMIIFTIIAMNIWSKHVVKEGYLVLFDSKVLYPGEKYRMWPFKTYNDQVIKAEFLVKTETIQLKCKNDTIPIKASSFMKINVEEARKLGITNIDQKELINEAEKSFVRILENQAGLMSVSELLKGALKPENLDIAGVPIIWEGRVQVSTA